MVHLPQQMPFDLPVPAIYTAQDFHVSSCNETAKVWIDRWPDWPGPLLILEGSKGSGKTHLAEIWRQRTKGALHRVIDNGDQTILGNKDNEEALFHTYNQFQMQEGHILLTTTLPVRNWQCFLPDLQSRLLAAPVARVGDPDESLIRIILAKHLSDRQLNVSPEVLDYLALRLPRAFTPVQTCIAALDRRALAEKRAVTLPLARQILKEQEDMWRSVQR